MSRKMLLTTFYLCLFILGLWTESSMALGVLFNRRIGTQQSFQKMWIKTVNVDVDIQGQIAVTHVDQRFYNELNMTVEAIYIFPLPENAMITELVYWFNGVRYVADIRERQAARKDYEERIRENLDPALLEYLGDNLFRLSIAPINPLTEVRTEITYVELLNYDFGKVEYRFMLNTLGLSPKPLNTVELGVDARSVKPFKEFVSPSHGNSNDTRIEKQSDFYYTVMFGDENFYPDKDFVLQFETVRTEVEFNVLTYTPVPEDSFGTDKFYALWITPPHEVGEEDVVPKDIIFTADVSGSMEGERIQQLKEALYHFIDLLNPADRFNIITFNHFVTQFSPDLVPATADNIQAAHDFVYQVYASGMTAINAALMASLEQSYRDTTSNNLIFLTDGMPTYGETRVNQIISNVRQWNTSNVHIFSFGIGDNISEQLLIRLGRENHGYATFISADDSIALMVNNHFTRISKPVMTNLSINFGGLKEYDHYPKDLADLYWGSQVLVRGLYTSTGTHNVVLSGNIGAEPIQYTQQVTFTDTLGGHRFVPRLWAKAKIEDLLELIQIYGETDELVNQIVELSLRFQILTPYTAFYSDPTDVDNNGSEKPESFVLYQNYPNPFNPVTEIKYALPAGTASYRITIKIYDVLGRLVKVLVNAEQPSGIHSVRWDSTDLLGQPVASGVYFYSLEVGEFKEMKKMLLLR